MSHRTNPGKIFSKKQVLASLIVFSVIAGFSLSGVTRFITDRTIRPFEFNLRVHLGQDPRLDPRIKIYSYDDSTLRSIKDDDLTITAWLDVLEGLAEAGPQMIMVDKIFGIAKGEFDASNVIQRLNHLPVPLVTGVFTTPAPLRSHSPIATHHPAFALGNWLDQGLTAGQLNWLPVKPGFVYGPDQKIAEGFNHLGHLHYEGQGRIELFRRYDTAQAIPHWSLLAAKRLQMSGDGLVVNSTQISPDEGAIAVNMIDPAKLRQRIYSMESQLDVTLTTNYIDANNRRWQARFDFQANADEQRDAVLESEISLSFTHQETLEEIILKDRLRNLLMELAAHRYVKIVYQSVHMNPPEESQGPTDNVDFEFKIDGHWKQIIIDVQTIDFVGRTMESEDFNFAFTGSGSDWNM